MGKQKTIFDLFRQEDEQFASQPSNDAWAKLERKLEGEKEVVPVRRINWFAIAASLLALVGAVFVLQMSSNNATNSAVAEVALMDRSSTFLVEDLVYADTEVEFQKEWQVSNKYRAQFAHYKRDFQRKENLAFTNPAKIKPRINVKPKVQINSEDYAIAEISKNHIATNAITLYDAKSKSENIRASDSDLVISNEQIASNESYDRNDMKEDAGNITMEMDLPIPVSPPIVSKMKKRENVINLNSFQWLVGTWEQKRSEMKSVEKWVADSSNSIWGTGYLLQEDDTVFTENMCIKQINDKIYFFQNIDTVNDQTKFVLSSNTANSWNFINSGGAPKNLIISNASDAKYNFEIQEIAPTQTHFLRQRNILQSNNAFRQMNRVD